MSLCVHVFDQEEEFYLCIYATREGDHVLFHHEGGMEVGNVDAKAQRLMVAVDDKLSEEQVRDQLLMHVPENTKEYECILFYPHGKIYSIT